MKVTRSANGLEIELSGEEETEAIGCVMADLAAPDTVIGLIGDLGSGKTRLSRAIAEALGVPTATVSSPTYVLIQEYDGRLPVFHFDAYRLGGPDDFDALGASEYFRAGGVCLIEWADLVFDRIPTDSWIVRIATTGPNSRSITIEGPDTETMARGLARFDVEGRST